MSAFETLNVRTEGPLGIIEIDRPKALNALNAQTLDELARAIEAVPSMGVRCLTITGAGDKAFVAGADIKAMMDMSVEAATAFSRKGHALLASIERLDVPVIAAVNGFALGGGCELALACDIIYASEHAQFGQSEVSIGVIPGFGGTIRLARIVGFQRARELVFSGRRIKAREAQRIGLAVDVFEADDLMPACRAFAEQVAKNGPLAVAAAKHSIRDASDGDFEAAVDIESKAFGGLFGSADQTEGMSAFVERRRAEFTGS